MPNPQTMISRYIPPLLKPAIGFRAQVDKKALLQKAGQEMCDAGLPPQSPVGVFSFWRIVQVPVSNAETERRFGFGQLSFAVNR